MLSGRLGQDCGAGWGRQQPQAQAGGGGASEDLTWKLDVL